MSKRGKGPWMCSTCQKRFPDPKPIWHHIEGVHAGKGEPVRVPKSERRQLEDAEESYASRAINAQLDRAMGLQTDDDWLLP